jgi:hypothetical protein
MGSSGLESFDDFLDQDVAAAVERDFPLLADIDWVVRNNKNNIRRFQHDETKLCPLMRHLLRELNSRPFLLFVETLTGIDYLLPDPYFIRGRPHLAERGDFLNIHADFNWHHKLQAHRRVNVLIYMNPGWQEEWGGHLELWNLESRAAEAAHMSARSLKELATIVCSAPVKIG